MKKRISRKSIVGTSEFESASESTEEAELHTGSSTRKPRELCSLALLCEHKDIRRAIELYKLAAEQKYPHAFEQLMRIAGNMKEKDMKKAIDLFMYASDKGFMDASYELVLIAGQYEAGDGVERDAEQAFRLIKRASETGSPVALSHLARCYENGVGVSKDKERAFELYTLSARKGNLYSMTHLAKMYDEGCGVGQNPTKAIELLKQAAEKRYPLAMFKLAKRYETGSGVEPNLAKAVELYMAAAAKGFGSAERRLRGLGLGNKTEKPAQMQKKNRSVNMWRKESEKGAFEKYLATL